MQTSPSRPSVMGGRFSTVPSAEIQRSKLDLSHGHKTTFDSGLLVPIYVEEALPGDTITLGMNALARLSTPLHPYMDNVFLNSFFFAVPNRLLWDNWERFNGAQDKPSDPTDYLLPQVTAPAGGWTAGSMGDYFGIPTGVDPLPVSALHFRAYNLIWNTWFRDQNLQDPVEVPLSDGPDDPALYTLKRRGKRHDYFTSSLPWPQKGESVQLPLTGNAPVTGIGVHPLKVNGDGNINSMKETGGGTVNYANTVGGSGIATEWAMNVTADPPFPVVFADLSQVNAATINQLRQAFAVQRLYERDARGGTRYTESIKAHFGVTSPDARLQRPEYLGGGQSMVSVTQVPQLSASETGQTPQGNLAAYATVQVSGHRFSASFTEHCTIIGMISVRADLNYQQGLHRMWSRRGRFDFFWPALAHIGEQAVLNKEIYAQGTEADEEVFGYQERHAEYRFRPSMVTGKFRSTDAQPLDTWHLAQKFDSLPVLGDTFIQDNPPIDRVVAVNTEPQFLLDAYFTCSAVRPMPVYGVPGMIDHF